jgi:hypothetical protein
MASPFSVFRRNQKIMITVVGVMAMFAFIFLDPLFRMLGGTRGPENPVIVRTNFGKFRAADLAMLRQQRGMVENFLGRVAALRVQKAIETKQFLPRSQAQRDGAVENLAENWIRMVMVQDRARGDAATMETMVLAHRAEELGIVVSDRAINDFLKTITQNVVSADEFAKIIAGMPRVSQAALFDSLRRELLASRLSEMFKITLGGFPPAQRWNFFEELNLKADAQVLPVDVEQFVKGIPDPPADKLLAFFERFQEQVEQPNSPLPGFKEPPKAQFQYFKANVDEFVARAAEKLTTEELHEYYDKNKAQFRALVLPAKDDEAKPDDATSGKAGAETPDAAAAEVPAAETGTSPATPATSTPDSKAATPEKPAAPATQKPAPPKSAAPPGKKSSSHQPAAGASRFLLTAAPQASKPAATKPAQSSADTPAAQQPVSEPAATEKPADGAGPDDHVHTSGDGHDHAAAATDETVYEPFEKVEEQIRKTLSQQKASAMVEEAFGRLSTKMREYANARSYEANKQENPELEPPAPLDFATLAKDEGVTAEETELLTGYEAEQEAVGKSFTSVRDDRAQFGWRQIPFVALGFSEQLYRTQVTQDSENNRYLWWKIKTTPETVPDLDEVRSKVVRAYKMVEARELALKKAEAYAKEARAAKKPLKEVFAGREGLEVTDTADFTRMTMGNLAFDFESSQPSLSPVHGVTAAGSDFMDAVFKSSAGETKVALNQPQTVAYVVQVERFSPERQQLEHEFLVEPFAKYAQLASDDQIQLYSSWLDGLDRLEGLEWLETPRSETRGEE